MHAHNGKQSVTDTRAGAHTNHTTLSEKLRYAWILIRVIKCPYISGQNGSKQTILKARQKTIEFTAVRAYLNERLHTDTYCTLYERNHMPSKPYEHSRNRDTHKRTGNTQPPPDSLEETRRKCNGNPLTARSPHTPYEHIYTCLN